MQVSGWQRTIKTENITDWSGYIESRHHLCYTNYSHSSHVIFFSIDACSFELLSILSQRHFLSIPSQTIAIQPVFKYVKVIWRTLFFIVIIIEQSPMMCHRFIWPFWVCKPNTKMTACNRSRNRTYVCVYIYVRVGRRQMRWQKAYTAIGVR